MINVRRTRSGVSANTMIWRTICFAQHDTTLVRLENQTRCGRVLVQVTYRDERRQQGGQCARTPCLPNPVPAIAYRLATQRSFFRGVQSLEVNSSAKVGLYFRFGISNSCDTRQSRPRVAHLNSGRSPPENSQDAGPSRGYEYVGPATKLTRSYTDRDCGQRLMPWRFADTGTGERQTGRQAQLSNIHAAKT